MIVLSDSQYYSDIANAIRAKNGENTQYKPSEMALAIKSLQGGGINCTLTISTVPNATVTATFENQTVTAVADVNGTAILELSKEGVWTVTATYEGETVSKEIDTSFALETELIFADPILENNSWETISKVAREGKATTLWNVGDSKKIVCNGNEMTARIIGFDHDDVVDTASYGREKAGITFEFAENYPTTQYAWSGVNSAVWSNSKLRTEAMVSFLNGMEDVKDYIVPVKKLCVMSTGNATRVVVEDTLFCLSEFEVFGKISYGRTDEGAQYAFYAAGNSPIKTDAGTTTKRAWWTRSVYNSSSRVEVTNAGKVDISTFSYKRGVSPAFCV